MRYRLIIITLAALLVALAGCKEPAVKSSPKKKSQTRDIAQVSANIERLTADELEKPAQPRPSSAKAAVKETVIDISSIDDKSAEMLVPVDTERIPFSQFGAACTPQIIRVTISTRGVPRNLIETTENRILEQLNSHAPQPFELRKPSSIDRYDTVWGNLHIDYQKQAIRLRKTSKTSPLRASYKFTLSMHLRSGEPKTISWHDWTYKWQDENTVANESAVNAHFWKRFEGELPLLTAIDTEQTEQWMRAQGLSTKILSGDLNALRVSSHHYYPTGCVVEDQENSQSTVLVRQLASPYAPPSLLSVVPIAMVCQSKSTFIVSSESASRVALYYHPDNSSQAWKSVISFQSQAKSGDIKMYVDDDVICLYTGNDPVQAKTVEFQCLDRSSGILKWRILPMSGVLRGFASTESTLYAATDHHLISVRKDGTVSQVQKIVTGGKQKRYPSCAFKDRMVFSTSPGHLVSYRYESGEIDWETTVLDPTMIHCSQPGILIVSETGGYLLAFDIVEHKPLWKYRTVATPKDIMTYGGVIYVLLERGMIALDQATGTVKAQIPAPWPITRFIQAGPRLYLDSADEILTWR